VLINGIDMLEDLKYLTGYVLQNDYLHPCLTVRECLTISLLSFFCYRFTIFYSPHYIAMLRLSSTLTTAEKTSRVDEIILELGLKDCANTLIGDELVRGISGILHRFFSPSQCRN
jgi:ABC-type multidrug transport system ATPase subunit